MRINVDIEQLVFEGGAFEGSQTGSLGLALRAELTRLLAAHRTTGLLASGGAVPALRAEAVSQAVSGPVEQGTRIAQAVHGAIVK